MGGRPIDKSVRGVCMVKSTIVVEFRTTPRDIYPANTRPGPAKSHARTPGATIFSLWATRICLFLPL